MTVHDRSNFRSASFVQSDPRIASTDIIRLDIERRRGQTSVALALERT